MSETLETALKQYFGYDGFRPMQREIIEQVLGGGDCVVLMPTGGGKSMCYQLPAVVHAGLTVVLSPLIALMKDQVQALQSNGIAAEYLNSSLEPDEARAVHEKLSQGSVNLLYVSPERLFSGNFIEYLGELKPWLFAIDEAHCISSWGHHFRPEYQRLHALKSIFPEIPIIALTATADRAVRSDIAELLHLRNHKMFVSSFDRPNLSMAVLPGRKKWEQLMPLVFRYPGQSGIIYCQSRNGTETLAQKLRDHGINATAYHAGLDPETRHQAQDDFIQGRVHIVCATIAFGMGIDKADVRFVVHYSLPGNLESYYQEIGRAGRDGKPSETVLFYSFRDIQVQQGFIEDIDNEQYKAIQQAKLQRMQEFAEAQVCRRKILLSYFSEVTLENCGNCDVCDNPPQYFDGTILAQMALSAVKRCQEQIGLTTLVDVLKGTRSATVVERGFDQVKTFGVGQQNTAFAWQLFLQQMVQQGLLEIDYKDHYNLKLTEFSQKVLFEKHAVSLVTFETIKERQEARKKLRVEQLPDPPEDPTLFNHLKALRRQLADDIRKPAYVVFSDASLRDMAAKAPLTVAEFMQVNGVGAHKAKRYANDFLNAIAEFKRMG